MHRSRVRYRVGQFFRSVKQMLLPVDDMYVQQHLSPELFALFQQMSRRERNHGITLCRDLERAGYSSADLLAAALLHDVGRIRVKSSLAERAVVVLAEKAFPRAVERWSSGEARGWRRAFVAHRAHPRWGADLAATAGASPGVVALIRQHHDPPRDDAALRALQQADEV